MINNISLSFYSLIYLFLLTIIFFGKERIEKYENKIYGNLIIVCILSMLSEIAAFVLVKNNLYDSLLYIVSNKTIIALYSVWSYMFCSYIYCVTYNWDSFKEYIKHFVPRIISVVLAITLLITLFGKLDFIVKDGMHIPSGLCVYSIYSSVAIYDFLIIACIIKNLNYVKSNIKRYIPLFIIVVFFIIAVIIQFNNPEIFLVSTLFVLTTFIMYFTIENPDVRLVEYEKKERELAQSANEAKSAFLSSMSHELRTPLNAIVGLSEDMLSYKDQVPNEVKEDCDDIVNASNTLLEIIGNILDISKIEGGKLEIIEADYLPKEEIESLLKIMRTKVEEKDLKFNVFIDPNIPECLLGDRLRIKQIINNFLSNAIKYTEKGSIDFGARWVNNSLELKVRDTGRGIKKEDMGKLFENFERLHVEKTSAVQGTGLGLAITKNLVDLMGGTIKVTSEFGVGSTFDVIIPQKIGNKDNIVREALSVEEKHELDYSGKKVLIVDDNKLNIKVLRKAVQSFNFEIDECYNGEEALKKIEANKYDLIFMDIMMPVMGGEEAMGILKQKSDFNTPVLALTADATTGAKERYLSVGFVDYLAKPFSRDTISTKLENIFKDMK